MDFISFRFQEKRNKKKADLLTTVGIGPFTPQVLRALRQRECMQCGKRVSEWSLVSNALVVEENGVFLYCGKCRLHENPDFHVTYNRLDIDGLIVHLDNHVCFKTGEKLDFFEALLSIRHGYTRLQKTTGRTSDTGYSFNAPQVFLKPHHLEQNYKNVGIYGDIESLSSCGECTTSFPASKSRHRETNSKFEFGTACYWCGFPHDLQWNMRVTYDEERKRILPHLY